MQKVGGTKEIASIIMTFINFACPAASLFSSLLLFPSLSFCLSLSFFRTGAALWRRLCLTQLCTFFQYAAQFEGRRRLCPVQVFH